MQTGHRSILRSIFGWCLLLLSLSSCTTVYQSSSYMVTDYPNRNKIDLNVQLCLSPELRNAKWEKSMLGDTYVIPLGEPLGQNAENLSKQIFSRVEVASDASKPVTKDVEAFLIPRMVLAERTIGVTAFSPCILSVAVEWTMKDLRGELVWVETVEGKGTVNSGNAFTHASNARKQIDAVMADLFHNSFVAITSSPEVSKFAKGAAMQTK